MSNPTTWHVRVDWTGPAIDVNSGDELMNALSDLRPAIIVGSEDDPEAMSATVIVEGETLRMAVARGLERVESAAGVKATGVEVLTEMAVEQRVTRAWITASNRRIRRRVQRYW